MPLQVPAFPATRERQKERCQQDADIASHALGAASGIASTSLAIPLSRHLSTSKNDRLVMTGVLLSVRGKDAEGRVEGIGRLMDHGRSVAVVTGIDVFSQCQKVPQEGIRVHQQVWLIPVVAQDDPLLLRGCQLAEEGIVAGMIVAVPMLMMFRVLCDHIPGLERLGNFLGGEDGIPGTGDEAEPGMGRDVHPV